MDAANVTRFSERATAVGAIVRRTGRSELSDLLPAGIAGTTTARRALPEIAWRAPAEAKSELNEIVAFAPLGVAETGSVLLAEPAPDRGLCLLADRLTLVVHAGTIVATLDDALRQAGQLATDDSHHLSFLSGPSRTGDIERVLATGVHGPGTLTIIIVEEDR